jgi:hypothetical protein
LYDPLNLTAVLAFWLHTLLVSHVSAVSHVLAATQLEHDAFYAPQCFHRVLGMAEPDHGGTRREQMEQWTGGMVATRDLEAVEDNDSVKGNERLGFNAPERRLCFGMHLTYPPR